MTKFEIQRELRSVDEVAAVIGPRLIESRTLLEHGAVPVHISPGLYLGTTPVKTPHGKGLMMHDLIDSNEVAVDGFTTEQALRVALVRCLGPRMAVPNDFGNNSYYAVEWQFVGRARTPLLRIGKIEPAAEALVAVIQAYEALKYRLEYPVSEADIAYIRDLQRAPNEQGLSRGLLVRRRIETLVDEIDKLSSLIADPNGPRAMMWLGGTSEKAIVKNIFDVSEPGRGFQYSMLKIAPPTEPEVSGLKKRIATLLARVGVKM